MLSHLSSLRCLVRCLPSPRNRLGLRCRRNGVWRGPLPRAHHAPGCHTRAARWQCLGGGSRDYPRCCRARPGPWRRHCAHARGRWGRLQHAAHGARPPVRSGRAHRRHRADARDAHPLSRRAALLLVGTGTVFPPCNHVDLYMLANRQHAVFKCARCDGMLSWRVDDTRAHTRPCYLLHS